MRWGLPGHVVHSAGSPGSAAIKEWSQPATQAHEHRPADLGRLATGISSSSSLSTVASASSGAASSSSSSLLSSGMTACARCEGLALPVGLVLEPLAAACRVQCHRGQQVVGRTALLGRCRVAGALFNASHVLWGRQEFRQT